MHGTSFGISIHRFHPDTVPVLRRVKAVKFGSGVLGIEPPVDGGLGGVALLDQSLDFPVERFLVGESLLQAGAG